MVAWGGLSEKIHGKWRVLKGGEIHSTIERTEYTSIHQADTPRYTRRIHQADTLGGYTPNTRISATSTTTKKFPLANHHSQQMRVVRRSPAVLDLCPHRLLRLSKCHDWLLIQSLDPELSIPNYRSRQIIDPGRSVNRFPIRLIE